MIRQAPSGCKINRRSAKVLVPTPFARLSFVQPTTGKGRDAMSGSGADHEGKRRPWDRRHLLGLEELSRPEIETILDTAEGFLDVCEGHTPRAHRLRGKVVVNLFFEPSTRTRTSFGLAAKRLGADTQDFTVGGFERQQGRDVHRHGQEHRGDGHRRRRRPPRRRPARRTCWPSTSGQASSTPATARTSTRRRACSTSSPSARRRAGSRG